MTRRFCNDCQVFYIRTTATSHPHSCCCCEWSSADGQFSLESVPPEWSVILHQCTNSVSSGSPVVKEWMWETEVTVNSVLHVLWGKRKKKGKEILLHACLTSALDGGEWSASCPGCALPPGKGPPVPTVQEAEWAPEPVWMQRLEKKSSASVRDWTPVIQSVVRYYTDWATAALYIMRTRVNLRQTKLERQKG
jgi:hypothetical protein